MMHQRRSDNGFAALSFPCKLYAMLEDAESRGFDHVINWQSGGKSFKVYQPEYFANHVMQDYFAQTKFKSFQRQLNIYGWKKVHHGVNKGGYVHKFFVRGQPDLCNKIARRSNSKDMNNAADRKELTVTPMEAVSSDPLTLVFEGEQVIMPPSIAAQEQNVKSDLEESEVDAFYDFFYPSGSPHPAKTHLRQGSLVPSGEPFPLQPTGAGHWRVNTQDLDLNLDAEDLEGFVTMLHSDDSENSGEAPRHPLAMTKIEAPIDEEENEQAGANSGADSDDELEADHNFPFKLHLMLESAEKDNYRHVVSWVKDGKAFKVHNNKEFVAKVLPIYFDQSKYESFRRQLNLYGFQRVARGADRGVISHPCFVEGARYLCKEIKRKQQTKASHPASSFAVAIHV